MTKQERKKLKSVVSVAHENAREIARFERELMERLSELAFALNERGDAQTAVMLTDVATRLVWPIGLRAVSVDHDLSVAERMME